MFFLLRNIPYKANHFKKKGERDLKKKKNLTGNFRLGIKVDILAV